MKLRLLAHWIISAILFSLLSQGFLGCSQNDQQSKEKAATAPAGSSNKTEATNATAQESPAKEEGKDDAIIAKVNGRPILANSFNGQIQMRLAADSFGNPDSAPDLSNAPLELKVEILDQLISLEIAYQEALKEGFAPKPAELDKIMAKVAESYGGDAENLKTLLSSHGDSEERLREQVAYNETVKNWRDTAFLSKAIVADSEAKKYYEANLKLADHPEQLRALQIVFPVPLTALGDQVKTRDSLKEKAQQALKEAQAGANFEDLIKKYMNPNTLSLTNNGQMGWVSQDGGFPVLEEALFKLKPGEISEVVETDFSFHILKVLEHRPAGTLAFEDVRPDILDFLTNNKINMATREKIAELREAAKIEIPEPTLAQAYLKYVEKEKQESAAAPAAEDSLASSANEDFASASEEKTYPDAAAKTDSGLADSSAKGLDSSSPSNPDKEPTNQSATNPALDK
jgi:peptidyl-prolyl cis-trans isomerase C